MDLKNKLKKTIALSGVILAFGIAAPAFAQYGPGPGYDSPGNYGPGYSGQGYYGGLRRSRMGRVRQLSPLARRAMVASTPDYVVLPASSGMGSDGLAVAQ